MISAGFTSLIFPLGRELCGLYTEHLSVDGPALLKRCFDKSRDIWHTRVKEPWPRRGKWAFKGAQHHPASFHTVACEKSWHIGTLLWVISSYVGRQWPNIIWSCRVLSRTINLFYFKLNDISSRVNTACVDKTHFRTALEAPKNSFLHFCWRVSCLIFSALDSLGFLFLFLFIYLPNLTALSCIFYFMLTHDIYFDTRSTCYQYWLKLIHFIFPN